MTEVDREYCLSVERERAHSSRSADTFCVIHAPAEYLISTCGNLPFPPYYLYYAVSAAYMYYSGALSALSALPHALFACSAC